MCKVDKVMPTLSESSKRKVKSILAQLSSGENYRRFRGRKLYTPWTMIGWITIPLKKRERMIVAIDADRGCHLFFVGSHERYNHFIGNKMRERLVNPFR